MGLEVVVPGQHPGPDKLLLEDGHEVQKALRGAVADVVHHVRRLGKAVSAVASLGRVAHDPHHALHDVVYVGEIPQAVAVVEYFYLLAFYQFVREAEVGHVGPAAGAVDGEEPKARGRYVVEFAVGVGQQLVALLGGSVETDGVVHLVVGGVRHLPVGAVDAGRRGVDQVLNACASSIVAVAARLQDVVESDQVALYVRVGIGDAVPDPGLGRQVDHDGRPELPEYAADGIPVRDGLAEENEPVTVLPKPVKTLVLEPHVIVVGDAVHADDTAIQDVIKKALHEIRADKAGGAGHQHRGAGKRNIRL